MIDTAIGIVKYPIASSTSERVSTAVIIVIPAAVIGVHQHATGDSIPLSCWGWVSVGAGGRQWVGLRQVAPYLNCSKKPQGNGKFNWSAGAMGMGHSGGHFVSQLAPIFRGDATISNFLAHKMFRHLTAKYWKQIRFDVFDPVECFTWTGENQLHCRDGRRTPGDVSGRIPQCRRVEHQHCTWIRLT